MTIQLNADGLQVDTLTEIQQQLISDLRAQLGVSVNTDADSFFGQMVNIFADFYQRTQNTIAEVYGSFDLAGAVGAALDARVGLTGTQRLGATRSTVGGVFTFTAAGTVSDGDQFQNTGTGDLWQAIGGPYTVGAAGDLAGQLQAVETGSKRAPAGTTWALVTANPNLSGFANSADASPGRDSESDPDLRRRQAIEIYAQGQGPRAAITARLSRVEGVTYAKTYHNPATSPVDAFGVPFKQFNPVVETDPSPPSADLQAEIFAAILLATGAGGQSYGTAYTGTTPDSEGQAVPVAFDVVTAAPVHMVVVISTANTEQQISDNLATLSASTILERANAELRDVGEDLFPGRFAAMVWDLQAAGEVSGVTGVTVDLSLVSLLGPYADPLVIDRTARPAYSLGAIAVAVV